MKRRKGKKRSEERIKRYEGKVETALNDIYNLQAKLQTAVMREPL